MAYENLDCPFRINFSCEEHRAEEKGMKQTDFLPNEQLVRRQAAFILLISMFYSYRIVEIEN